MAFGEAQVDAVLRWAVEMSRKAVRSEGGDDDGAR